MSRRDVRTVTYPHDFILAAKRLARTVLSEEYRYPETRVHAYVFLRLLEDRVDVNVDTSNLEPYYRLLYSLVSGRGRKSVMKEYRQTVLSQIERYKKRQTKELLQKLGIEFRRVILLHFLDEGELGSFVREISKHRSDFPKDSLAYNVLTLLHAYLAEEQSALSSADFLELGEFAIILAYKLAFRFPERAEELLWAHYEAVRGVFDKYSHLLSSNNLSLSDSAIVGVLRAAIFLHLCGYEYSLRLSYQEVIRYFESVSGKPLLLSEVGRAYDLAARQWHMPMWVYIAVGICLQIVAIFREVYLPSSINLWIISFELPFRAPLFTGLSLLSLSVALWKTCKLKKALIAILERGRGQ